MKKKTAGLEEKQSRAQEISRAEKKQVKKEAGEKESGRAGRETVRRGMGWGGSRKE